VTLSSEKQVLGTTHAELGAYLLGIWGLPALIVEAVEFHHNPSALVKEGFTLTTALHVANGLHYLEVIHTPRQYASALDMHYLERLGCVDRLDGWADLCRELIATS
jgi:HD-like signal output (HDOD) protein